MHFVTSSRLHILKGLGTQKHILLKAHRDFEFSFEQKETKHFFSTCALVFCFSKLKKCRKLLSQVGEDDTLISAGASTLDLGFFTSYKTKSNRECVPPSKAHRNCACLTAHFLWVLQSLETV